MKKKLFTLLLALIAIATTGRAQNTIDGHEYVDLGLPSGTLWATCNIGASKPEEYGDYFAWGETEPKDVFKWSNYSCCDGSSDSVHDIGDNISGSEYDVAYKKWGNSWTMPSREQFEELYSNTSSEWIVVNGVNGWRFTSSNGNSIFLPAAGEGDGYGIRFVGSYGNYWTASDYNSLQHIASDFYFSIEGARTSKGISRCCGFPIRPVASLSTSKVWHLVTDSGEQFPMNRVGMLVAVDESAYFSVLDINGNVLADEVLRVHFVNSDPVSVENITMEKTQNILKRYVDNELTLVGAKGTVNVYSVDGVKVATRYATGQETIINVSSLPSGVYIVKCGNQSFKFNKK